VSSYQFINLFYNMYNILIFHAINSYAKLLCKSLKKVKQFLYRAGQAPGGSRRLRLLDFMTIGT